MARSPDHQVVFRDYPIWIWLIGVMTLAVTAGVIEKAWERILFSLAGIVIIAFASILTVSVNRRQNTLSLHYRSLFRASTRAYPLSEIGLVRVAEDREGERMYRVELILFSGDVVPLRGYYTAGKGHHERRALRLRAATGVRSEITTLIA